jgi:hypothetical protein
LGYAKSLTQLHIGFGIGLVVCLWALAGIAWRNRARRGLVAFTVAWGLFSWVLGLTQNQILPGSLHWLVEAAHLAAGVIAMGIGGQLVTALGQHQINPSASA